MNKQAVGVEFDFDGQTRRVRAKIEVILSAGAVNSAQLLMLSGIGPMSELLKFKVVNIVYKNLFDFTYFLYILLSK